MHLVKKAHELFFDTEDQVGVLAKITAVLAKENINLLASHGYGAEGKGHFHMITENNAAAINALKTLGYEAKEREVVTLKIDHQVGALKTIIKKIADTAINIKSYYGTAGEGKCLIVLDTDDNEKVVTIIK